jgi:hypothetical protein
MPKNVTPIRTALAAPFFERPEEEIPAKWLREVNRMTVVVRQAGRKRGAARTWRCRGTRRLARRWRSR